MTDFALLADAESSRDGAGFEAEQVGQRHPEQPGGAELEEGHGGRSLRSRSWEFPR